MYQRLRYPTSVAELRLEISREILKFPEQWPFFWCCYLTEQGDYAVTTIKLDPDMDDGFDYADQLLTSFKGESDAVKLCSNHNFAVEWQHEVLTCDEQLAAYYTKRDQERKRLGLDDQGGIDSAKLWIPEGDTLPDYTLKDLQVAEQSLELHAAILAGQPVQQGVAFATSLDDEKPALNPIHSNDAAGVLIQAIPWARGCLGKPALWDAFYDRLHVGELYIIQIGQPVTSLTSEHVMEAPTVEFEAFETVQQIKKPFSFEMSLREPIIGPYGCKYQAVMSVYCSASGLVNDIVVSSLYCEAT